MWFAPLVDLGRRVVRESAALASVLEDGAHDRPVLVDGPRRRARAFDGRQQRLDVAGRDQRRRPIPEGAHRVAV